MQIMGNNGIIYPISPKHRKDVKPEEKQGFSARRSLDTSYKLPKLPTLSNFTSRYSETQDHQEPS